MSRLNLWRTIIGLVIILIGIVGLLNNLGLTTLTAGQVIGVLFTLGLVALGVYMIRSALASQQAPRSIAAYFGDTVIGRQPWELRELRIRTGLGDVRIDLTTATIPTREGVLDVSGLVGDVRILLPRDLEVKAHGSAGAGSIYVLGRRSDGLFPNVEYTSPGFNEATKRVNVEVSLATGDIHIRRAE